MGVGIDRRWHVRRDHDVEIEALGRRKLSKCSFELVAHVGYQQRLDGHLHRARLDLRQVQDFVDQPEQV